MQSLRTVLITGSNKGIGFALAHELAKLKKYSIIMTSRNQKLGQQAVSSIKQEFPQSDISYYQLDICDIDSIKKLVEDLTKSNIRIDVLVNNAALGYDQPYEIPAEELATSYFGCNYFGTVNLTQNIIHLLTNDAKIINVSSRTGALENHSKEIQQQLLNSIVSRKNIQNHIQNYLKGCKERNLIGYYWSSYGASKTFLNIWNNRILKNELKEKQSAILMSPGFCLTDMIRNSFLDPRTNAPEPKDPVVGVQTLIYIIKELPYDNVNSGKFYYENKEWNIHQVR